MTIQDAALRLPLNTVVSNVNIYGVPLVIGAKKGYPNFNKMVVQTVADVSRRLEIRRNGARLASTNQMYMIGVSNRFGIEGWNSYATGFQPQPGLAGYGAIHFCTRSTREKAPRCRIHLTSARST